jgi:hypothetical protein
MVSGLAGEFAAAQDAKKTPGQCWRQSLLQAHLYRKIVHELF